MNRNEYVEDSKLTFAAYARRWIETYDGRTARGIRPGTLRDYRRALGFTLDEEGRLVETGGGAVG